MNSSDMLIGNDPLRDYIMIAVGIILFFFGFLGLLMRRSEMKRNDRSTEAVVVKLERLSKRQGAQTWEEVVPTLEYKINGKRCRQKYLNSKDLFLNLRVGQKLTIVYSSKAPEYIHIADEYKGKKGYIILMAGGIFVFLLGLFL